MAEFDPFTLDLDKVRSRLKYRSSRSKKKICDLPIDDFVRDLAQRRRAPKLRGGPELEQLCLTACPYTAARDDVWGALRHAQFSLIADDYRVDANQALQSFSESVANVRTGLSELHRNLVTILEAQLYAFEPDVADLLKLADTDRLLSATSVLDRLNVPLTNLYRQRSQRVGNVWRIEFATALFGGWWRLTGSDPTPAGPFVNFLDAAFQSLSNLDLPTQNWERAVRTALARAPVKESDGAKTPWRVGKRRKPPALDVDLIERRLSHARQSLSRIEFEP